VSTSPQAALTGSKAESKAQPKPEPRIVVVLVEPAGPLNVGSVARLCANFAIAQLRLVAPRCNPLGEEARRMAVHGQAQLEQAATYPDLAAAIADCRRVVATSGRMEREDLPLEGPATALGWLIEPEVAAAGRLDPGAGPDPAPAPVALVLAGRIGA
jgi:tRNA/rRNA methyltransferase